MYWTHRENQVTEANSGFTLVVEEGTFLNPYAISTFGAEGKHPIELARLIREGLRYGRRAMQTPSRQSETAVSYRRKVRQLTA